MTPIRLVGSVPASVGPLRAVLTAVQDGVGTREEIARHTGLSESDVDAALDHLRLTGRLSSASATFACPTGQCGGCPTRRSGCRPG